MVLLESRPHRFIEHTAFTLDTSPGGYKEPRHTFLEESTHSESYWCIEAYLPFPGVLRVSSWQCYLRNDETVLDNTVYLV